MNIFVQFKSEHYYNVIKGQCHEENTTFESEQVFCTGRYLNNDQESVFFSPSSKRPISNSVVDDD